MGPVSLTGGEETCSDNNNNNNNINNNNTQVKEQTGGSQLSVRQTDHGAAVSWTDVLHSAAPAEAEAGWGQRSHGTGHWSKLLRDTQTRSDQTIALFLKDE